LITALVDNGTLEVANVVNETCVVLGILPDEDAIPLVSVALSSIAVHCARRAWIPEATLLA